MGDPNVIMVNSKSYFNTHHLWTPKHGLIPMVVRVADLHRAWAHQLSNKPGDYGVLAVKVKDGISLAVNVRDYQYVHHRQK